MSTKLNLTHLLVCFLADVDPARLSSGVHSTGSVDSVSKQTVAWLFCADNTGSNRTGVDAYHHLSG